MNKVHIYFTWKYNSLKIMFKFFFFIFKIISPLPSLSSLETLPDTPPPHFSHSCPFYYYTNICIYTYVLLTITCSVCIVLFIGMFPELTIWYWITNWFAIPWGKTYSHSQHSFVAFNSLCRVESSISPSPKYTKIFHVCT